MRGTDQSFSLDPGGVPENRPTRSTKGLLVRFLQEGMERGPSTASARVLPLAANETPAASRAALLGELSDDELMQLCAADVNDAFATLLLRHERRVRNYCAKWCGSVALSDEIAQEVFVDLWRHRHEYQGAGRFEAYLFTFVRNRCFSSHRKANVEKKLESYNPAPRDANQLQELLESERSQRVNEAISRLRPKLREALLMRYGAELDYHEIGRIIGVPESTVRSRVFLAICELKEWAKEMGL